MNLKNLKKLRNNLIHSFDLNNLFIGKGFEGNEDMDVICTYLAAHLHCGHIDLTMIDHMPKLIRQLVNGIKCTENYVNKQQQDGDE